MLHITQKTGNTHKKAFATEVFMSLMLMSIFSASFAQASDITADMVIKLTNKARESAKVAKLKKNDLLMKAAEKKAQDMVEKNYFAHISPQGKTPWNWIEEAGYDYRYAGENLAINFTNAEDEQEAWMDSELHRKNILNPDYEEIGVAVKRGVIDGQKTIVTVQQFGAKVPKVNEAVDPIEKAITPKMEVAGAAVLAPAKPGGFEKISDKMSFDILLEKNPRTILGWFGIFAVALIVLAVDVAAVFHKKHRQFLILHDARKRQA